MTPTANDENEHNVDGFEHVSTESPFMPEFGLSNKDDEDEKLFSIENFLKQAQDEDFLPMNDDGVDSTPSSFVVTHGYNDIDHNGNDDVVDGENDNVGVEDDSDDVVDEDSKQADEMEQYLTPHTTTSCSKRGRFGSKKCEEEDPLEEYAVLEKQDSISGGPANPEILKSFRGHVAYYISLGQERKILKCHKQTDRLSKWKLKETDVKNYIKKMGLSHLVDCMHGDLNMPLISAFVERWHPETNSFHFSFGEMTITLHDVAYILNVSVVGEAIFGDPDVKELKGYLQNMLKLSEDVVNKEYHSGTIKLKTIFSCCSAMIGHPEEVARGYLLWLLGSTLFVDRSGTSVSAYYLPYLLDLDKVKDYAWGAACLAYLYRQLGVASRFNNAQLGGCLTLLQVWIFEYFPMFRPTRNKEWNSSMAYTLKWLPKPVANNDSRALLSTRRRLDKIRVDEVTWTPFDNNPGKKAVYADRVLRQFGYVQIIPGPVFEPRRCYRGPKNTRYVCIHDAKIKNWKTWQRHCLNASNLNACKDSHVTEVVDGYDEYFMPRSRVSILRDEPDVPMHDKSSQMTETTRLQYLGDRLYFLHPEVRHQTDKTTFWKCLDEVTRYMEDWMPKLQEERGKRVHGGQGI